LPLAERVQLLILFLKPVLRGCNLFLPPPIPRGPALFAPSLEVERDGIHNRLRVTLFAPRGVVNACRAPRVPSRGIASTVASIPHLLNPAQPVEQVFSNFDQPSEKSCTTSIRPIFRQLFGDAGHHLEMEPKTVGHRTIVFAHGITDQADYSRLLVQADLGLGLPGTPVLVGADRPPECIAKFFWRLGRHTGMHISSPCQERPRGEGVIIATAARIKGLSKYTDRERHAFREAATGTSTRPVPS
jgi:hypothetical protein